VAWYDKISNAETQNVGTKKPNQLELYDCSGNISEWCFDMDKSTKKNNKTEDYYFEQETKPKKLSSASIETLSIIAYKQPITKSEIESIRGVSVDRIISNLEERKFVRNCGRQESGRKANLYEVTDKFLSYLGIRDIRELPDYDLFKDKIKDMENISTDEN